MAKTSTPPPAHELTELRSAVEELIQHVRLLTRAVDDLTTELQWRNNELRNGSHSDPPFVMTSMPRNPTADDWQLSRVARDGTLVQRMARFRRRDPLQAQTSNAPPRNRLPL